MREKSKQKKIDTHSKIWLSLSELSNLKNKSEVHSYKTNLIIKYFVEQLYLVISLL